MNGKQQSKTEQNSKSNSGYSNKTSSNQTNVTQTPGYTSTTAPKPTQKRNSNSPSDCSK